MIQMEGAYPGWRKECDDHYANNNDVSTHRKREDWKEYWRDSVFCDLNKNDPNYAGWNWAKITAIQEETKYLDRKQENGKVKTGRGPRCGRVSCSCESGI